MTSRAVIPSSEFSGAISYHRIAQSNHYRCIQDPGTEDDLEKMTTDKSTVADTTPAAGGLVTVLDWTGPNDPENPENWSAGKKAFHIAYVGIQCFVVYVGFRRSSGRC